MNIRSVLFVFTAFCTLILSCNHNGININDNLKVAKTVPINYIDAKDNNFSYHQDTVFYSGLLFSGFKFSKYPNGDTASIQSYFNGVEEGFQYKCYEGGQIEEKRFYINGKKEGQHQGWWPNGKLKYSFSLSDDLYEGEFKEWLDNELLIKHFNYKNGIENGSQRLWWADGSVRANYVIKNGRKYGLLGLKVCSNPYDSVVKK